MSFPRSGRGVKQVFRQPFQNAAKESRGISVASAATTQAKPLCNKEV